MARKVEDKQQYLILCQDTGNFVDIAKQGDKVLNESWFWTHDPSKLKNKIWTAEASGDYWRFTNRNHKAVLTVQGGDKKDGTPVIGEQSGNSVDRQLWTLEPTGDYGNVQLFK